MYVTKSAAEGKDPTVETDGGGQLHVPAGGEGA
jgi:hypothetical protein